MAMHSAEAALPIVKPPAAEHLDPWEHDEIFQGAEFTTLRKAAKHAKAVFDKILEEFVQTAAKGHIMVAMKTNLSEWIRSLFRKSRHFPASLRKGSYLLVSTARPKSTLWGLFAMQN